MDIRQLDFKDKRIVAVLAVLAILICGTGYISIKAKMKEDAAGDEVFSIRNLDAMNNDLYGKNDGLKLAIEEANLNKDMWIHVIGSVNNPGAVKLQEGQRIKDAIEAAGGLLPEADVDAINMVYALKDGQKIYVPSKIESDKTNQSKPAIAQIQAKNTVIANDLNGVVEDNTGIVEGPESQTSESNKKININIASESELDKLPGVGPATAVKIIEYREKSGGFNKIEDIMNVYGIGKSKFDKMKEMITTN